MTIIIQFIIIASSYLIFWAAFRKEFPMMVSTLLAINTRVKIGWIPMLVISGSMPISYLILFFVDNMGILFILYAAISLYAFLVLLIPFREGKKWAWAATWILPVVLALTAYFAPDYAPYYYGLAAVFTLGLLLTMKDFFSRQ